MLQVNTSNMTREQLITLIASLEAEKAKKISLKVSEKGAVSIYGLGRFPTTLYASQWEAIFNNQEMIKQFILDNTTTLASKAN